MKTGAVSKSWSIHFSLKCDPEPLRMASLYGFKSEDAMKPVLSYLENNSEVTRLHYQCSWKNSKMGPWMRREKVIR